VNATKLQTSGTHFHHWRRALIVSPARRNDLKSIALRSRIMKKLWILPFVVALCSLAWSSDEPKELDAAAQVLQGMSNQVPSSLLKQAKCIAVIPKMTKAGFIVGGKHGNGVVSCRTSSGWSAPAFISMTGGSVGLQAGAEQQDVLLLMNAQGAQELKNGHWELKGEAAAAGPSGGSEADASTGWKAPVLSYSNASGAFAGADVGGAKIGPDDDANHKAYGESAFQAILEGQAETPAAAKQFMSALQSVAGM
jgi:SH3 domain-containing YSC84-like protein 1